MILDAADKQMDLILCASVSRFARNVSDCITKVRQLKTMNPSHPVGVYFETENIYTLDPESNHLLSIVSTRIIVERSIVTAILLYRIFHIRIWRFTPIQLALCRTVFMLAL